MANNEHKHDDNNSRQPDDRDMVLPEQRQTFIYLNEGGTISIKQSCWPDDDSIITIAIQFVPNVIDALQRIYNEETE